MITAAPVASGADPGASRLSHAPTGLGPGLSPEALGVVREKWAKDSNQAAKELSAEFASKPSAAVEKLAQLSVSAPELAALHLLGVAEKSPKTGGQLIVALTRAHVREACELLQGLFRSNPSRAAHFVREVAMEDADAATQLLHTWARQDPAGALALMRERVELLKAKVDRRREGKSNAVSVWFTDLFTKKGREAQGKLDTAQRKLTSAKSSRKDPATRALALGTIVDEADRDVKRYDKVRSNAIEFGPGNLAYLVLTFCLEPFYRRMSREGKKRWDHPDNVAGAVKEYPLYTAAALAVRRLFWGKDFDLRAALYEAGADVIAVGGTLVSSYLLRRKYGATMFESRAVGSAAFGTLAGVVSYVGLEEARGYPLWVSGLRATFNGFLRLGIAHWLLQFFPDRSVAASASGGATGTAPPSFDWGQWGAGLVPRTV